MTLEEYRKKMSVNGEFSKEAKEIWDKLPRLFQEEVLNTAYCFSCGDVKIVDFKGEIEDGDLVLRGKCIRCRKIIIQIVGKRQLLEKMKS